ncbi:hypothetical protein Pmar_PMAR013861 [Perkinsus marinus ATCC 50983]|uniref:Uncharacterized protein n=1 Tax=Perkinsus marinus (strain ATCC 50983 / TXsc) TaxID=423536 RepID=C5KVG3_PERM5|nr:hypothetical protein Pmar_PMAR013861 [Perkinsus marinus ATCC 50983]EER11530.1 hypothetical protein Pmar_PMAR013861 [Perkinsus marinus ATCC 50983]|eukprot:XP_002779735.1 hypothetical protein Pmar_PMAR013861 [Perkinsus marinus ATCC 50983]
MKIFLTFAVVIINAVIWEGCSSNGGGTTTASPATTAPGTTQPPGPTTTHGPTPSPGPPPIGTFLLDETLPIGGSVTGRLVSSDADPDNLVITTILIQTNSTPPSTLFNNTSPVPFHMEGARVVLDDTSVFPPLPRVTIDSAVITYLPPDDIQINITQPAQFSVTLHRAPPSRLILNV